MLAAVLLTASAGLASATIFASATSSNNFSIDLDGTLVIREWIWETGSVLRNTGIGAHSWSTSGNPGPRGNLFSTMAAESTSGKRYLYYAHRYEFTIQNDTWVERTVTINVDLRRSASLLVQDPSIESGRIHLYGGLFRWDGSGNGAHDYDFRTDEVNSLGGSQDFTASYAYGRSFTLGSGEIGYFGLLAATSIEIEAVPEPASMTALGLGALAALRRRRKA